MDWNPTGLSRMPRRVFPMMAKGEIKSPADGRLLLQVASGVLMTKQQSLSSEESTICTGSSTIENDPDALVTAVEITFPPHCNSTFAFGKTGVARPRSPMFPLAVQYRVPSIWIKPRRVPITPPCASAISAAIAATEMTP